MTHRLATFLLAATFASAVPAQGLDVVYTQTNAQSGNGVQVTLALPGGHLVPFATFATGGDGTGSGLGSQGALAFAPGNRLLAVDAGSDEITLFRSFFGALLWRTDTVPSGGTRPTSVAAHGNLVYVLNAGSDTVNGFRLAGNQLQPIAGASYPLSAAGAAGAQVGFSPDGRFLVATERATNTIAVWRVRNNGRLHAAQFHPSAGTTPFGFLFRDDGVLVVSEAAGGAAGASVASSYRLTQSGNLVTITSAAPTNQSAACWIAIPRRGNFAYTTNTASGTITGYAVNRQGDLTRLDANGVTGDLGAAARPIDFEFDPRGRFLFVLDSAGDAIATFRRQHDGSLTAVGTPFAVVDGSAGLLVR